MSMQVDFEAPRQIGDVVSIRAAIKGFDKSMNRMMVLMKELGNVFEDISHAFDALTTLSFSNPTVRKYVHHFSEEIIHMKEGAPFMDYNRLVHEDVLRPVKALKTALDEAERAACNRMKAYDKYEKAKKDVENMEKKFARRSEALSTSKEYPLKRQKRSKRLDEFHTNDDIFQTSFRSLVTRVETVTANTMQRYLHLNAAYMTSLIEALTKTDPTVDEAVAVCRQQLHIEKSTDVQAKAQGTSVDSPPPNITSLSPPSTAISTVPVRAEYHANVATLLAGAAFPSTGPPAARYQDPQLNTSVNNNTDDVVSSPKVTWLQSSPLTGTLVDARTLRDPPQTEITASASELHHDDYEDIGSVSEVCAAHPMPQYNFGRSPYSVASSAVAPRPGYMKEHDTGLNNAFLKTLQ